MMKFSTSQRVNILNEQGAAFIKGAISRSSNNETGKYYLTFQNEADLDQSFHVKQDLIPTHKRKRDNDQSANNKKARQMPGFEVGKGFEPM